MSGWAARAALRIAVGPTVTALARLAALSGAGVPAAAAALLPRFGARQRRWWRRRWWRRAVFPPKPPLTKRRAQIRSQVERTANGQVCHVVEGILIAGHVAICLVFLLPRPQRNLRKRVDIRMASREGRILRIRPPHRAQTRLTAQARIVCAGARLAREVGIVADEHQLDTSRPENLLQNGMLEPVIVERSMFIVLDVVHKEDVTRGEVAAQARKKALVVLRVIHLTE